MILAIEKEQIAYDRIPKSDRNSFSSSIFSRIRTSLSLEAMASSFRSPRPFSTTPSQHGSRIVLMVHVLTSDVGNVSGRDILPVFDKPVHSLFETRESLDVSWLEDEGGVKRHETDERPDRQLLRVTEAPLNGIIVEPVLFIPEGQWVVAASVGHGVRDEQEVLKELDTSQRRRTKWL